MYEGADWETATQMPHRLTSYELAELPRLPSGKILRRLLRDGYQQRSGAS